MRLDRALNLVIKTDDMFVHSTPISRDIFEAYFLVISKTHAAIFSQGLGIVSGPGIAYLMLRETCKDMDASGDLWKDVQQGLVNEIIRLSNVVFKGDRGWQTLPLQVMIDSNRIDADEMSEILGQLVFFTCASKVLRATLGAEMIAAAAGLWGSEVTVSGCTEFQNSLPTSMPAVNTGETVTASSIPQ